MCRVVSLGKRQADYALTGLLTAVTMFVSKNTKKTPLTSEVLECKCYAMLMQMLGDFRRERVTALSFYHSQNPRHQEHKQKSLTSISSLALRNNTCLI